MGEFSIQHLLILGAIIMILFGSKKIPELMKGIGEGIFEFKRGFRDRDEDKR